MVIRDLDPASPAFVARAVEDWMESKPVSVSLAALEIAARLAREQIPKPVSLTRPRAVVRYLYLRYGGIRREVVGAVFLDRENRLLEAGEFFRGTAAEAVASPARSSGRCSSREPPASCSSIPTRAATPAPSERDVDFTRRMRRAAEAVGIAVRDHLVIAGLERWYSFYSERALAG